jgi:hypothetical protein
MGREEFSAPEESQRERDRKVVQQSQYVILGALIGSMVGSADLGIEIKATAALLLIGSIVLVNRYWSTIHPYF